MKEKIYFENALFQVLIATLHLLDLGLDKLVLGIQLLYLLVDVGECALLHLVLLILEFEALADLLEAGDLNGKKLLWIRVALLGCVP